MDLELVVNRDPSDEECTLGSMLCVEDFECYTLEDIVREVIGEPVASWKIAGETAIPAGRYQVIIDFSDHFQKTLPHILNVPGFSGVRIHGGNKASDTEGCILVGDTKGKDTISGAQSHQVLAKLQAKIQAAIDAGDKVWITINS